MDTSAIPTSHLPNLRDVGGWPTTDGATLRRGTLYRSAALSDPGVATDPTVESLGLAEVVDMRTAAEAAARPDHVPAGARVTSVDILRDTPGSAADLPSMLARGAADPGALLATLDARAVMERTYRQFVSVPTARSGFAKVARRVLHADGRPVLVHCTAGKDRTGWAVAILMTAAGATPDSVEQEYISVRPAVGALFADLLAQAEEVGLDAERLRPLLDVEPGFLRAGMNQVEQDFGDFDTYLREGLGLEDSEVTALRAALVGR